MGSRRTTNSMVETGITAIVLLLVAGAGCGDVGFQHDIFHGTPGTGQPDDDTADPADGDDDTGGGEDDDTGDDDTGGGLGDDDDSCDDTLAQNLVANVYFLDLGDGEFEFVEPAGLGALLQAEIPRDDGAIFSAVDFDACDVEMLLGAGSVSNPDDDPGIWDWEQSEQSTVAVFGSRTDWDFQIGPFATTTTINDLDVWMGDAVLAGRFLPDGAAIVDTDIEFLLDTTEFEAILGFALCDVAPCVTCPPSCPHQGDVCVRLVAQGGSCPRAQGVTLTPMP